MKERLFIQAVYPLHALGCQGPVPCARPAPTVAPRQFPVDKGTWPSPCSQRTDAHFGDSSDSSAFCIWPDGPDQSNPSTPYRLLPDRARDWLQLLLLLLQHPRLSIRQSGSTSPAAQPPPRHLVPRRFPSLQRTLWHHWAGRDRASVEPSAAVR